MGKNAFKELARKYMVSEEDAQAYLGNYKLTKEVLGYADKIKQNLSPDQKIKLMEQTHLYTQELSNAYLKKALGYDPRKGEPIITNQGVLIEPLIDEMDGYLDYDGYDDYDEDDGFGDYEDEFFFDYDSFFTDLNYSFNDSRGIPLNIVDLLDTDNKYFLHEISGHELSARDFSDVGKLKKLDIEKSIEPYLESQEMLDVSPLEASVVLTEHVFGLNKGLFTIMDKTASLSKDFYLLQDDLVREQMKNNGQIDFVRKAKKRLVNNYLERTGQDIYEALRSLNGENKELTNLLLERLSEQKK